MAAGLLVGCGADPVVDPPVPETGDAPIIFPVEQWDAGREGETLLRVLVDINGRVDSVEVSETSGVAELDSAAVRGMRTLQFRPARQDSQPVAAWVTVPVHFRTSDSSGGEAPVGG